MNRTLVRNLFLYSLVSGMAFPQDPVKVDPQHFHVLFENSHIRVLEYHDKPGHRVPMHSHPVYMSYLDGPTKVRIATPRRKKVRG